MLTLGDEELGTQGTDTFRHRCQLDISIKKFRDQIANSQSTAASSQVGSSLIAPSRERTSDLSSALDDRWLRGRSRTTFQHASSSRDRSPYTEYLPATPQNDLGRGTRTTVVLACTQKKTHIKYQWKLQLACFRHGWHRGISVVPHARRP